MRLALIETEKLACAPQPVPTFLLVVLNLFPSHSSERVEKRRAKDKAKQSRGERMAERISCLLLTPLPSRSIWLRAAAAAFLTRQYGAGDAAAVYHEVKPHVFLFPVPQTSLTRPRASRDPPALVARD